MNEQQAQQLTTVLKEEFGETRLDYGYWSRDYGGHFLVAIYDQLKPREMERASRIAKDHGAMWANLAWEDWINYDYDDADKGGYWDKRTQLVLVDPDDPIPFFDYDRETKHKAIKSVTYGSSAL